MISVTQMTGWFFLFLQNLRQVFFLHYYILAGVGVIFWGDVVDIFILFVLVKIIFVFIKIYFLDRFSDFKVIDRLTIRFCDGEHIYWRRWIVEASSLNWSCHVHFFLLPPEPTEVSWSMFMNMTPLPHAPFLQVPGSILAMKFIKTS